MLKRIICLVLIVLTGIMVLMTGCTGKNEAPEDNIQVKDDTGEKTEEVRDFDISSDAYVKNTETLQIDIQYPVIENMNDEDVQNKINSIIGQRVEDYKKLYYEEDDEEFLQTINAGFEIKKKTEKMLSISFFISLYAEGAAHPNNLIDAVTFDLNTGNEIEFKDLFKPDTNYEEVLNSILKEKVKSLDFELFEEYAGVEKNQEFYLTDSSLVVFYQEYVYTPHAVGPLLLEVPFNEIEDILKG